MLVNNLKGITYVSKNNCCLKWLLETYTIGNKLVTSGNNLSIIKL